MAIFRIEKYAGHYSHAIKYKIIFHNVNYYNCSNKEMLNIIHNYMTNALKFGVFLA
jgi:hypothetical protein